MRTTPEAIDLQADVRGDARRAGTRRARWRSPRTRSSCGAPTAIHFAVAVFTNLTQDHLDFHPDMEAYFQAKRRLFAGSTPAVRIANVDDPYGRRLADEFAGTVTFALDADADYRAVDVRTGFAGSEFTVRSPDGDARRSAPAARALQRRQRARRAGRRRARSGVALDGDGRGRCADAGAVPGRFEPVDEGQAFAVLVDYAHTPDSLENVLLAARDLAARPRDRACSARAATATAASAR